MQNKFKWTDLLERKIEDSDIEAVRNAKRYYQSCVDVGMKKTKNALTRN